MSTVEKIEAEIEKLPPTEVARLTNELAERQVRSAQAAKALLDKGKYAWYRDLSKAVSGSPEADVSSILESTSFEDFLRKAKASVIIIDPFPKTIPGSPLTRVILFESHHAPTPAFSMQRTATYAVLSDRSVVIDSIAKDMFTQMHKDLLVAVSFSSGPSITTNTNV